MTTKERVKHWWSGCANATDAHHDEIFRVWGMTRLAEYRFAVTDDLTEIRVATNDDKFAANGIWTLAELLANGEPRSRIERLADCMLACLPAE